MQRKTPAFSQKNQNKVFVLGFFLILAVTIWSLVRPLVFRDHQEEKKDEAMINKEIIKAPTISLKDFSEKMKNNEKIFVFDIRSADEFSRSHLAGSINAPSGAGIADKLKSLDAEKISSIVVLNSGSDVLEMAKTVNGLVSGGFVNAKYLQGGIADWQNKGYTLISGGNSPQDQSKIKKVTVEKIAEELSGGDEMIQFVDVREKKEFDSGHIPNAINIPLSDLEKDQKNISPVKKVILYGENEDEAKKAAVILFDLNVFNAFVLDGGLPAWKSNDGKIAVD